jgi:hypothetical protein
MLLHSSYLLVTSNTHLAPFTACCSHTALLHAVTQQLSAGDLQRSVWHRMLQVPSCNSQGAAGAFTLLLSESVLKQQLVAILLPTINTHGSLPFHIVRGRPQVSARFRHAYSVRNPMLCFVALALVVMCKPAVRTVRLSDDYACSMQLSPLAFCQQHDPLNLSYVGRLPVVSTALLTPNSSIALRQRPFRLHLFLLFLLLLLLQVG